MQKQASLKKNALMNALLTTLSFVFPLITFPYVSRVLLPAGTGRVSFAASIVSYFVLFAQLGIPTYGIRACAQVRDDKEELNQVVQEILSINIVIVALTYIVFWGTLLFFPRLQNDKPLYLILSIQMILNAIGVEWVYKAQEKYAYITIRSIIFKFVAVILTFLLIKSENDYIAYAGITIFAASASNVLNFLNLRTMVSLRKKRKYNFRRHLKPILIFFAMSCATTIYTNLDNVMLGLMKGDTEVGYYNASVKIRNIFVSVVTSLGVVLLPRASYYFEQKLFDEFYKITRKALNFVFIIAVPTTIFFVVYAKEGIYFLAGDAYGNSILPMQILMITLLFIGMTNIMGIQMLVPMGKEINVLISEIVGALVDVVINLMLIPKYGAFGAAIGTLLAEIIVWIFQLLTLNNSIYAAFRKISYLKILLSSIIPVLAIIPIKNVGVNSFIKLSIAGPTYFILYGLILLFVLKEPLAREMLSQVMNRIKPKNT